MTDKSHGRRFESMWSKLHGFNPVANSGAGPIYKLDISQKRLLFSLKATKAKSFSIKQEDLEEIYEAIKGPGGIGSDHIGALISTFVEGENPAPSDKVFITLDFEEFKSLLQDEAKLFEPNKTETKYENAQIPSILKGLDTEE